MKGWFSTGSEVADEMLASGNVAADETLSRDDVVAMLEMDSECEGVGGKKVDTKVGTKKAGLPCADSSEGTLPKATALDGQAVDEDWPWFGMTVEAEQGTEACSAARAALTACTTVARNSRDG